MILLHPFSLITVLQEGAAADRVTSIASLASSLAGSRRLSALAAALAARFAAVAASILPPTDTDVEERPRARARVGGEGGRAD
jgi:hypothetical protein